MDHLPPSPEVDHHRHVLGALGDQHTVEVLFAYVADRDSSSWAGTRASVAAQWGHFQLGSRLDVARGVDSEAVEQVLRPAVEVSSKAGQDRDSECDQNHAADRNDHRVVRLTTAKAVVIRVKAIR